MVEWKQQAGEKRSYFIGVASKIFPTNDLKL